MPAEWERHTRTWMALPPQHGYVATQDPDALAAWTATANAIAGFEPVSLLATPASIAAVRAQLDGEVELVEAELDDGWLRDSGPTFVVDDSVADGVAGSAGALGAVHWTFNAWGGIADTWQHDARIGASVADRAGAKLLPSKMVNEGGGICVDGEGTVIVTESVQLNDRRNPGWTKGQVEDELARTIGASTVIWLERGLMGDMQEFRPLVATNGHVDVLAAFIRPGVVVVHGQPDPDHYDHAVMAENTRRLREATDARGRKLEIITIDAPEDTVIDGVSVDHSYVNFSYVNDGIVMSTFGDERADANAQSIFKELLPGKQIAMVNAEPIFRNGGGVHCITQHEPDVAALTARSSSERDSSH